MNNEMAIRLEKGQKRLKSKKLIIQAGCGILSTFISLVLLSLFSPPMGWMMFHTRCKGLNPCCKSQCLNPTYSADIEYGTLIGVL
jgi:hypothetical protein